MNLYFFGNMLNYASLLMIASSGAAFALRNGQVNLGGEGQIYLGGFAGAIFINFLVRTTLMPAWAVFTAAMIGAVLCGLLFNFVCALLKLHKGADELLTTFLLSSALIPLIDGAVAGPLRTKEGNLLCTEFIPENMHLLRLLPPSSLNISAIFAVVTCILSALVLTKTYFGKKIYLYGIAPDFTVYSGYSKFNRVSLPLCLCGALHSLAGFFAVTGTYYTCHSGFYAGAGWNALSIALLSKSNPAAVIVVSLIYSLIFTFAQNLTVQNTLGFDLPSLFQGAIFLLIALRKTK